MSARRASRGEGRHTGLVADLHGGHGLWSPVDDHGRSGRGALLPYWTLACFLCLTGAAGAVQVLVPVALSPDRVQAPVVGSLALVLAGVTALVLPRLPGWWLNVMVAAVELLACHLAATSTDVEILQVVPILIGWIMVWNGYFLTRPALTVHLLAVSVVYLAAIHVNPQRIGLFAYVVSIASFAGLGPISAPAASYLASSSAMSGLPVAATSA